MSRLLIVICLSYLPSKYMCMLLGEKILINSFLHVLFLNKLVHAPTRENGCAKYQYDPLNIVGCRVEMKAAITLVSVYT